MLSRGRSEGALSFRIDHLQVSGQSILYVNSDCYAVPLPSPLAHFSVQSQQRQRQPSHEKACPSRRGTQQGFSLSLDPPSLSPLIHQWHCCFLLSRQRREGGSHFRTLRALPSEPAVRWRAATHPEPQTPSALACIKVCVAKAGGGRL